MSAVDLAREADIPELLALMKAFHTGEGYPFRDAKVRAALEAFLKSPAAGFVYTAREEGRIAGYIAVTFGFSFEFLGRNALVDELYVVPEMRGRGIGKGLMEAAVARCKNEGIHAMHLEVEPGKSSAQKLYEALGFEIHKRRLMTKWIREAD